MAEDRHSVAESALLLTDPDEIALREAENGIRQFELALEIVRSFVKEPDRKFKLRSSTILQLHNAALEGLHLLAGTWRNTPVRIGGSSHQPPQAAFVSEEIEHLCDYVNDNWSSATAVHLAAFVLWKLNWIHPFADGNGRTARAVSYVVMSVKLDSVLPGAPTIPEQIAGNKKPYYDALEAADKGWNGSVIDVTALEEMLGAMLSTQLLSAAREASGELDRPSPKPLH